MKNWSFRKSGINCYIVKKDKGDYKIMIYQKGKSGKYSHITLWLPDDESFDFIVKQLEDIQWDIWNENVKKYFEKEK